jgi:dienelactone hydrolase
VAGQAAEAAPGGKPFDTLQGRWAALAPHVRVHGPADGEPRPALLMFHGCGGPREQVSVYAEAAAAIGLRSFSVDSFAPRGWGRRYAQAFVCTGSRFRGAERAGDVLAAVHGVADRPDVDASRLLLLGWSHGSWAVMDLMTMPLTTAGEAGLIDPTPEPLAGVRGLYMLYPWSGPTALSRTRPWVRTPPVLGVVSTRDHLATVGMARKIYEAPRRAGAEVELWEPPGSTHSFDEPGRRNPVMRYDPALGAESIERFTAFARRTLSV